MTAGGGLDREAVRRRAEAATPGPWWFAEGGSARNHAVWSGVGAVGRRMSEADAEFIAHARTDVPALLDALKAAEAENERHRKANLVRAVVRHAEGKDFDGWVADLINAEDFDAVPWRVAAAVIEKAKAAEAEVARLRCRCINPESFCGGADTDPDEPGFCASCASLDAEEHCLRCPFECCTEGEASRG